MAMPPDRRSPSPTAADFAALARSSPWLWSTLRFTLRLRDARWLDEPVRAWLRRPDRLRVESLDGQLRQIVHEPRHEVAVLTIGDQAASRLELPWPTDRGAATPQLRADGLVMARPGGPMADPSLDAPMYQSYFWVAMLDPVELADGRDAATGNAVPGTRIEAVTETMHDGRLAWEALVHPVDTYEPRCGCCALLRSRAVDVAEWGESRSDVIVPVYPEAYRVRLDRATGVCVHTEAIGGDLAGSGHDVRIEAVDEPMGDELFRQPRSLR